MATRSRIGIVEPDGTVTSIACHFDGYLRGVGDTLAEHYTRVTRIRRLMRLGDVSTLGASIGACEPTGEPAVRHAADAWPETWQEYEYLWRDGAWHYRPTYEHGHGWRLARRERVQPRFRRAVAP